MENKINNRIKWVHLRLSDSEYNEVKKKRANSTARNLSQYIRDVIFNRPVVTTYRNLSQDDMMHQLAVVNRELNAMGNNLNQVTKRLHTLRPPEQLAWGCQLSAQAEAILLKLAEVKELVRIIAERWLRL